MLLTEPATTGALRRGSWWLRALQAVVLVGAAYYLITKQITPHWPDIRARQFTWQAGPLFLGSLIVLGTLTVLVGAWTASLRWCAAQITALDAAKVWFTANLARFLPGGVWQFASLAVMASRYGVSTAAATATVLLEQIVLLITGLAVVAVFTPAVLHAAWWQGALVVAIILGIVILALPRPGGPLGRWLERAVPSLKQVWSQLGARHLLVFVVILIVPWLMYGTAFRLLASGLLDGVAGSWGFYIAAFTGSYLAGVIAVFAPAGLFVREAALIGVLTPVIGGGDAAILAVASRIWLTALEIVAGIIVLALPSTPSA
jgi:glycosyltransferase 2 family protein